MFPPEEELRVLVARMEQGDREALVSFHEQAGPWVYGMLLRLCAGQGDAARVLRQTFVELWRQAPLFDHHFGPPLLWALSVARGLALEGGSASEPLPPASEELPSWSSLSQQERGALLLSFFRPGLEDGAVDDSLLRWAELRRTTP